MRMRWNATYGCYAECDDRAGHQCTPAVYGAEPDSRAVGACARRRCSRAVPPALCLDLTGNSVGRINPFYWPGNYCPLMPGATGQCWRNLTDTGVWCGTGMPTRIGGCHAHRHCVAWTRLLPRRRYSFQTRGRCAAGAQLGDAGCAWLPLGGGRPAKSVALSCLRVRRARAALP
jgi:hypothetical protein